MFVRYERTSYLPSRRTISRVQLGEIVTRTSVLGRLVTFAAIGGVLAAAMVIPVVAATGILVRNQADKFTTLSLSDQGLPQRGGADAKPLGEFTEDQVGAGGQASLQNVAQQRLGEGVAAEAVAAFGGASLWS